jgi:hypothetical protein
LIAATGPERSAGLKKDASHSDRGTLLAGLPAAISRPSG